ncbi:helix-turn-helix domain-containing protein [Pontibacter pamirensis]|uniref:helix-turn-helix domain-containing protein n=1 Tax=Pontibacter pamirensis TaxID=2562824 RepID=UPI001389FB3E|nr:helix-turn-helix domain-containing protein [Pontibacter pamirensis]
MIKLQNISLPDTIAITVEEAAKHLGLSEKTLYRHIALSEDDPKRLPAFRVGVGEKSSAYRVTVKAIDEWIGRNMVGRNTA